MAKWLGVPVLLVVDCYSLARSAAAMIKGFKVCSSRSPVVKLVRKLTWSGP